MKHIASIILCILAIASAKAQIPANDIWLADYVLRNDSILILHPEKISDKEGYNNQPAFLPDGRILFVHHNGTQSDVWMYDPEKERHTQLTSTEESEYSPTPLSEHAFSTVVVEKDSSQRLYRYEWGELGNMGLLDKRVLFPAVKNIGYHVWLDEEWIGMFLLEETHNLHIGNVKTGKTQLIDTEIGRSLQKHPESEILYYYQSGGKDQGMIKAYHISTGEIDPEPIEISGYQDFIFLDEGRILAAGGSRLMLLNDLEGSRWEEMEDLSESIGTFYRIAIDPARKKIAFVTYEGERP